LLVSSPGTISRTAGEVQERITRTKRAAGIVAATIALTAALFAASTDVAHSQQQSTPKKKPTASQQQKPAKSEKLTWHKVGKDFRTGLRSAGKQIGHDSGKVGRAIEYGVRKGGEDVSVTTHRAAGKNSIVHDRGKNQDYLVRPDGTRVPVSSKAEADKLSGKTPRPGDKHKKP